MLKPGLGKGLGRLMNGDRVAGHAPPSAEIGRGLHALIAPKKPAVPETAATKVLLPTWYFFAADILLLGFSVAICFDAPKPMDVGTVVFCAASITIAAILGITGVMRGV
jgi:hypothetical protein